MTADSITDLVASWADATPHAAALEHRGRTLTYRDLRRAAEATAADISDAGIAPGQVVAVPAERSAHTVVAILAALHAGCAYVPLDLDGPGEHTELVVRRARPRLLLVSPTTGPGVDDVARLGVHLDATASAPRPGHTRAAAHGEDPAYLMPTSGTTGSIKLVEVTHRNVCYNVRAVRDALGGVFPHDVYLHFASFAFSSSVRQLFLPLSSGARIVLAHGAERLDPHELLARIRRSRVSVLDVIPSVLAVLLEAIETDPRQAAEGGLDQLRLLLTASEPLPGALVRRWHRAAPPHIRMINMYGQTETTGIVCVQPVCAGDEARSTVPLGTPIAGASIHLTAPDGSPAAPGQPGQITVTSEGVALGYRADPQLTAAAFPAPSAADHAGRRTYRTGDLGRMADGTLEYLGRIDSQVKIRGQRVDLAELERLLEQHPAVAEAVVAAADADGQTRLAAVVRAAPGFIDAAVYERLRELPNGLRILDLNRPETDFMYEEIFVRQVYLRHGITLTPDACIIDAGANIGLFSLFAAASRPRARVFAVEPAAPTAATLKTNMAVNGCRNVAVRAVGLSDHRGTAMLTYYPRSVGLSSVHARTGHEAETLTAIIANQLRQGAITGGDELQDFTADLVDAKLAHQTHACTLTRISDLMAAEGIERVDLLKIDVQRSERELLDGVDDADWPRINQIVVEVHDLDGRLEAMRTLLAARGYTVESDQDTMFAGSDMHYLYARRAPAPPPPSAPGNPTAKHYALVPLQPVSPAQVLSFLATRVAPHQMPASLEILEDLPRTVSGKADRAQITRRIQTQPPAAPTPPADPHLARIAAVWAEVLGKPVGPGDDFFKSGGNSLAAARVITRLRDRYHADLPIRWIFDAPRLDAFAELVRSLTSPAASTSPDTDQDGMP